MNGASTIPFYPHAPPNLTVKELLPADIRGLFKNAAGRWYFIIIPACEARNITIHGQSFLPSDTKRRVTPGTQVVIVEEHLMGSRSSKGTATLYRATGQATWEQSCAWADLAGKNKKHPFDAEEYTQ